jgi:NodT family efflux transporter outer membrane factor (OMF) lipoprotein
MVRHQLFILIGCLALVSCAVGPDFEALHAPRTESFTESPLPEKTTETTGLGGAAQHFVVGGDIPEKWWELFNSKPLNELLCKGIKQNYNLKAAQAALRAAEQNYWASVGSLFPFVTIGGDAERQRFNLSSFNQPNARPSTFNLFNAGVNVAYTLDIFGGIRRQIETTAAQEEAQKYEEDATYISLTADIVTTAITEASLRAQIEATRELVAEQKKNLDISEKRFNVGAISKIDALAQATQLYQTESSLPPLENALSQTRTTLSILIGELPSDSKIHMFSLEELTLPTELPVSIPCQLVSQRPDVKAAEAQLHAASAQIGVATANLLPQVTITGNYGGSSNFLSTLFKDRTNVWALVGSLVQPVFEGGTLIARREAAIATFEQAYAQYNQVVLVAYKDVADVLKALELDAIQVKITNQGEKAARETLKLTEIQYNLGAISYLNLIVAQRQYHLARIDRIRALASRYSNTAALFKAMGGAWWKRGCEKPAECQKPEVSKES